MSSPQDWVWDAFSLYDSLYSYMPPFIIRMNTKARRLDVEPSKFKRFIWCCSVFININILVCGTSFYVVEKWYMKPKSVFVVQSAAAVGILLIGILASYTCMVHYIYREDHVFGVNALLRLHISKIKATTVRKGKGGKQERDLTQIILGYTLKGLVWGFWFIPALVPIGIFEGLDPLRIPLLDSIPPKLMDKYPVHISLILLLARFLLMAMASMEISRFFAMFFLLFISGIVIYIDFIERFIVKVAKSSAPLVPTSFQDFVNIRLVVQILSPVLRREICCLMFTGFFIAVGASIGAVQCYEIFPWYMYYTVVLMFIIAMIIIYATLPFGTEVNEKTTFAIQQWHAKLRKCAPHNRLLVRKLIKSFVPVSVRCGPFFKLKQETKSTYFDAIFTSSCDLNMSVDIQSVFENGI